MLLVRKLTQLRLNRAYQKTEIKDKGRDEISFPETVCGLGQRKSQGAVALEWVTKGFPWKSWEDMCENKGKEKEC